jgi:hypothetical protein
MIFIRILFIFLLAYVVGFVLLKIIWRGISDLYFSDRHSKKTTFGKSEPSKKKFFDKEEGEFTDYEEIK